MKNIINVLAVAALLIGGCMRLRESSSQIDYDFTGVDKVAIVSVEGAITSEVAKDQIADFFSIELLEKGYAPIDREQVRARLRQQEAEVQDLSTIEKAVDVGLILDVPAVLAIRIPHFDEQMTITAKMINVEDGSTLWLASETGRGRSNRDEDSLLTNPLAGPPPMREGENMLPLTPEEAENAKGIIESMCKTLPAQLTPAWD
jgi:hypothetical protein